MIINWVLFNNCIINNC